MNSDATVYEFNYIQSRLKPKIELVNPPWEMQARIVRTKCPQVDKDLLRGYSDLINVRFGPLCGLKSDISRGPRSAQEET